MGEFEFLTVDEIHQVEPELVNRVTKTLREKSKLYERTVVVSGLNFRFISSVNSTLLGTFNDYGRSLGGIRVMDYSRSSAVDKEEYARFDAINLGRAMARKWAILTFMGTQLAAKGAIKEIELRAFYMGGGKSVIYVKDLKDYHNLSPADRKTLFQQFGEFLENEIKGDYMGGEDMNTTVIDMDTIKSKTNYVSCFSKQLKGSGNPSPVTAEGVYRYMLGLVPRIFGSETLNNLTIGIQGVGNVGASLAEKIRRDYPNAKLVFTTLDEEFGQAFAKKVTGKFIAPDDLLNEPMDIFSPNADSEVLNENTIPKLAFAGVKLVCGAANCQFEVERGRIKHELAEECDRKGIYVAPDYPANLGGILNLSFEFPIPGNIHSTERAVEIAAGNKNLANTLYEMSNSGDRLPYQCANYLADHVIAAFVKKTCPESIETLLLPEKPA